MRTSRFLCCRTCTALCHEPAAKVPPHCRCCCHITTALGILLPQNCCIAVPAATALLSLSLGFCCHINKLCPAVCLPPHHHPSCRRDHCSSALTDVRLLDTALLLICVLQPCYRPIRSAPQHSFSTQPLPTPSCYQAKIT